MENSIGYRLTELIKALEMTPNAFAVTLGVKTSIIYNIQKGKNKPSFDLLYKISEEFGISTDWLIKGLSGIDESYLKSVIANYAKKDNKKDILLDNILEENVGDFIQNAKSERLPILKDVVNDGVELGRELQDNSITFNSHFEGNRIAFYLNHSNKRLDGLLSVAIDDLKEIYESYRKLILFSESVGAPVFMSEKYPEIEEFKKYKKNVIDAEFEDNYGLITDKKVLKCTKLVDYEQNSEHFTIQLNELIGYMYRYADLYQGYLATDYLNRRPEETETD